MRDHGGPSIAASQSHSRWLPLLDLRFRVSGSGFRVPGFVV